MDDKLLCPGPFARVGQWCGTEYWIAKVTDVIRIGLKDPYLAMNLTTGEDFYRSTKDSFIEILSTEDIVDLTANNLQSKSILINTILNTDSIIKNTKVSIPIYDTRLCFSRVVDAYGFYMNDLKILSFNRYAEEYEEFIKSPLYNRWGTGCIMVLRDFADCFKGNMFLCFDESNSGRVVYKDEDGIVCGIINPYYTRSFVPDFLIELVKDKRQEEILSGKFIE